MRKIIFALLLFASQAAGQEITSLTLYEVDSTASVNYPLSFGHPFAQGDVDSSISVSVDGTPVTTQFDVKRHWPDGSIKFGIVSIVIPSISTGDTVTLSISASTTTNNTGHMTKAQILAEDVESVINLTGLSDSGYSGNLSASFYGAIDSLTTMEYWMQGAVCTEVLARQNLNNSLNAKWEARFYPGTDYGVRISNVIENVEGEYRGNVTYSASIDTGTSSSTSTAYSKSSFQHNFCSRWRKVLWVGPEPPEVELHYDLSYLISTGSVMNYDTSLTVSESVMAARYATWLAADTDIMGNGSILLSFPTTGGREDIGILPAWSARYLLSMDNRMREIVLGNGELSGGIPMHYRESASGNAHYGLPISVDDRPTISTKEPDCTNEGDVADRLPAGIGTLTTPWTVDRAHMPSLAYLPYLITGDYFFYEELMYWGHYVISREAWERLTSTGIIADQIRGEAWAGRTLANAAAFALDGSAEREYLTQKLSNNIVAWHAEQDDYPLDYWDISPYASTDGLTADVQLGTSPWQEDFVLLSLTHMDNLGFSSRQIIDWYHTFHVNRCTHPDFNHFNAAAYRFPAQYTDGTYPQTWAQANASYIDQPTSLGDPYWPYSYQFVAMAAMSCLTGYPNGQAGYNFYVANVTNQSLLNDDPTWAFIPSVDLEESMTLTSASVTGGVLTVNWSDTSSATEWQVQATINGTNSYTILVDSASASFPVAAGTIDIKITGNASGTAQGGASSS